MNTDGMGHISLNREIRDHPIWKAEAFTKGQAWTDLIMLANWKDNYVFVKNKNILVKRGQRLTNEDFLSKEWKWSRGKVRRFLEYLENETMIETTKSTIYGTMITIVNYNKWQGGSTTNDTTNGTTSNTTDGQQTDCKQYKNNKDNKDNKDNKSTHSTQFDYVISEWNNLDKNISNIQTINSGTTRYKLLKARENEYGKDNIVKAIRNINNSSFLKGYEKSWKITFDWFIKPNNFIKVLEGNYNDSKTNKPNNLYSKDDRTDEAERQAFIERKLQQKIPINYKNRR